MMADTWGAVGTFVKRCTVTMLCVVTLAPLAAALTDGAVQDWLVVAILLTAQVAVAVSWWKLARTRWR